MNILDLRRMRGGQLGLNPFSSVTVAPPLPYGGSGQPTPTTFPGVTYFPSSTPAYNPANTVQIGPTVQVSGGGNTVHYFDSIASLVSQVVGAVGKNPTQQIATGSVFGVGQGYSPASETQAQALLAAAQHNRTENPGTTTGAGGGVAEGFLASAGNFVSSYPIPIAIAVILYFLYQRDPKKK